MEKIASEFGALNGACAMSVVVAQPYDVLAHRTQVLVTPVLEQLVEHRLAKAPVGLMDVVFRLPMKTSPPPAEVPAIVIKADPQYPMIQWL